MIFFFQLYMLYKIKHCKCTIKSHNINNNIVSHGNLVKVGMGNVVSYTRNCTTLCFIFHERVASTRKGGMPS